MVMMMVMMTRWRSDPIPTVPRCIAQVLGEFPPSTRTLQNVGNLTIIDVSLQDDGVYECVASNLAASIVTVTVIIVHRQCRFTRSTAPPLPFLPSSPTDNVRATMIVCMEVRAENKSVRK